MSSCATEIYGSRDRFISYLANNAENLSSREHGVLRYLPYWPQLASYLVDCSDVHKFLYTANPKTGCSSVKRLLYLIELSGKVEHLPKEIHDKTTSPLPAIDAMVASIDSMFGTDDFTRLTTIRNPYTRSISCYLDKIVNNEWERNRLLPQLGLNGASSLPSFLEFLTCVDRQCDLERDIHWATQAFITQASEIKYHIVGRFENLGSFLGLLQERLAPQLELKPEDFTEDRHKTRAAFHLSSLLGKQERDLVERIYCMDFKTFGYSHDPFFALT